MEKRKKSVSPIVSTVLLIMIVIILAIIILLWARGFVKEAIEKEIAGNKKRVNEYCLEVKLRSIINDDGSFGFENIGNVPIYAFNVKLIEKGSGKSEIKKITDNGKVNPGFSIIIDSSSGFLNYDEYEEVKIIPILLGETKGGLREFECPEETGFIV